MHVIVLVASATKPQRIGAFYREQSFLTFKHYAYIPAGPKLSQKIMISYSKMAFPKTTIPS
jgi:hypothetical protein